MDALETAVQARRRASIEATITGTDLERMRATVDAQGNLVIGGNRPTHWSMGQVASLIGAPASYLRALPAKLVVDNVNHGLSNRLIERDSDFKLLVGTNGSSCLRAVTSGKYTRIWDHEVVQAIRAHAGGFTLPMCYDRGQFGATRVPSGLYASDHDVFAFMVNEKDRIEVNGEQLMRGFYAWNSETGGATFGFAAFLFRFYCGNAICWGVRESVEIRVRHTGRKAREALEVLFPRAIEALSRKRDLTAEVNGIKSAMADVVAKTTDGAVEFLRKQEFTSTEATEGVASAVREEKQPYSRWGLVQGLTGYARQLEHTDKRLDLEKRAAALLPTLN